MPTTEHEEEEGKDTYSIVDKLIQETDEKDLIEIGRGIKQGCPVTSII